MAIEHDRPDGHVLVLGRADPILWWMWKLCGSVSSSLLIRRADLLGQTGLVEHRVVASLTDGAAAEDWIALGESIHRVHPITLVAAYNDIVLPYGAAICEAVGAAGHPVGTVRAVHHKPEFRRLLRERRVQDVAFVEGPDATQVRDFGARHGWPVVVKPTLGAGSYGVTRVAGPAQVEDALSIARMPNRWTSGDIMVEQYLDGAQYGVESFSENGEHCVLMVERMFIGEANPMVLGVAAPADLDTLSWRAIERQVVDVLTALDVRDGPTHCEVILTADGPRVIEAHLRPAGDRIPELVRHVAGVDIYELCARRLLGQRVLGRVARRIADRSRWRGAAIWYATAEDTGVLNRVYGVPEARALAGVTDVELLVEPGQRLRPPHTGDDRYASVLAVRETRCEALATARTGVQRLRFALT